LRVMTLRFPAKACELISDDLETDLTALHEICSYSRVP
jgi:hypothetical protein